MLIQYWESESFVWWRRRRISDIKLSLKRMWAFFFYSVLLQLWLFVQILYLKSGCVILLAAVELPALCCFSSDSRHFTPPGPFHLFNRCQHRLNVAHLFGLTEATLCANGSYSSPQSVIPPPPPPPTCVKIPLVCFCFFNVKKLKLNKMNVFPRKQKEHSHPGSKHFSLWASQSQVLRFLKKNI